MMVMVEGMAKSGFFRWLCVNSALLGINGTVAMLADFVRDVIAAREESDL